MDPYVIQGGVLKCATSELKNNIHFTYYFRSYKHLQLIFSTLLSLSFTGERHVVNAFPTPASVRGVNLLKPASILLPTSQSTPMESVGIGMTGKMRTLLRYFCIIYNHYNVVIMSIML